MKAAIEDHRASSKNEPRSIYGKIISEADRQLDCETIIRRTIQFSLKNFPNYTFDEHYQRIIGHIQEKYGENVLQGLYEGKNTNVELDVTYYPDINEYNGQRKIQIIIQI